MTRDQIEIELWEHAKKLEALEERLAELEAAADRRLANVETLTKAVRHIMHRLEGHEIGIEALALMLVELEGAA